MGGKRVNLRSCALVVVAINIMLTRVPFSFIHSSIPNTMPLPFTVKMLLGGESDLWRRCRTLFCCLNPHLAILPGNCLSSHVPSIQNMFFLKNERAGTPWNSQCLGRRNMRLKYLQEWGTNTPLSFINSPDICIISNNLSIHVRDTLRFSHEKSH